MRFNQTLVLGENGEYSSVHSIKIFSLSDVYFSFSVVHSTLSRSVPALLFLHFADLPREAEPFWPVVQMPSA